MPVLEPLMCEPTGLAASHHRRQHIPRKTPRAPQVLWRAAACTPRDSGTRRRHRAARREHRHSHLRLSDLRGPRRSQPDDVRLRDRVAGACLQELLHRVPLLVQILLIHDSACLYDRSRGSARTRGAPERRVCGQPASQQQQPQPAAAAAAAAAAATVRRALEAPAAPACTPISALSLLRSGDSLVPCWCWQVQETPPSHAA